MNNQISDKKINRRSFLRTTAAAGAGLAFSPAVLGAGGGKPDDINIALLGCGAEGQVLMNSILKIPGIRIKAVCDIWTDFNQKRVSRLLTRYKHENNTYEDYQEMLAKEKDLDAVIIATPDFWHAPHTIACLEAGLHVYCEKEMSNTLEGAKKMMEAAKKSGKLLQIGHQRRSNPKYRHVYDKIITDAKLLGKITCVNGQWNRSKTACEDLGFPRNAVIDPATLKKYGYESMQQFRNWRWYKGLGGGPIVDLGSHQIDIYSWFLGTNPKAVMASGGVDYWKPPLRETSHEWYDNVMAIYEYELGDRTVRAFYQTITSNSSKGYFENFMGDEGSLEISEASGRNTIYREAWVQATSWEKWIKMGIIKEPDKKEEEKPAGDAVLDVRESPKPPSYDIPVSMGNKHYHQFHLENFFDAIRGKAKLNCPGEIGYETAVTVLKVNEAIAAGRRLEFKPEDFEV
ncbi:MAG: Gfo/Idh/MocA family oxidoreductase [Sedimentisphaerales bacterium]|nr:Gfo/Idh/MocA family oxidoreductase [Sedimentisphaerales bacterium]